MFKCLFIFIFWASSSVKRFYRFWRNFADILWGLKCVCSQFHIFKKISFSDVTAAILKIIKYPLALLIFLQFPWDLVCNKNQVVFVFIANFIVLHYQLRFKMTVWKTVKTGSVVNLRTKCRFLLISTRWTQIYAYLMRLTKKWPLK